MVVATSRQRFTTASPVTEGVVNLVSSVWLAQHIGALGVALGTLLGAVVGVAMHFGVSMRYTQSTLAISRLELFFKGMLRPAAMAIPSVLLLCLWWLAGTSPLQGCDRMRVDRVDAAAGMVYQFDPGGSGPGCASGKQQNEPFVVGTGRIIVDISVAMCTYNGSRFLAEQLKSIAEQTLLPCELIVCDDGSTDSTSEIVRIFAEAAPFPVRFIRNEQTLGSTNNFAKAVCLCRGDAIALCDQDDVWRKDKLERMAEVLDGEPEVGGVFSDASLVDENSQTLARVLCGSKDNSTPGCRRLSTTDKQRRCSYWRRTSSPEQHLCSVRISFRR